MFAAIIVRAGGASPRDYASGEALLAALMPFTPADVSGIWQGERAIIVQAIWHNTPESLHERAPEICPDTGRVIASWLRIDNRDALCAALGLVCSAALTDPQIVLAAHRQWGTDCAARLEGDFSFVIYDPTSHETYCARDAIGARPLCYHLTDSHFIVATSVAVLRGIDRLKLTPSLRWSVQFALLRNFDRENAAYEGVKKLLAAHDMLVGPAGEAVTREYHRFDLAAPHAVKRDPIWVERYREAFERAVAVRARSAFLVGAESSAGLDSSSVLAQLAEVLPHSRDDLHCFGMALSDQEPEMLLLTSAMSDVRHTHILTRPEQLHIDAAFHRALTALGHPPEHWQMLAHPSFFEMGQSLGIRTLMSGYGGDEVVTSFADGLSVELHARGEYRALFAEMHGPLPMRIARFARQLWRGPADLDALLGGIVSNPVTMPCIRRDAMEQTGLADDFARWSNPKVGAMTVNKFADAWSGFRYARTARLESAAIFAATYGIDYRWPLLDRRLIAQYFATPSIEKRARDMGRYLHRRAVQGRVPGRIVWQKTKDMGGFIGGSFAASPPARIEFADLPPLLQSMIDDAAFAGLQDALFSDQSMASHDQNRRIVFLWQIRQLMAWLDPQAAVSHN